MWNFENVIFWNLEIKNIREENKRCKRKTEDLSILSRVSIKKEKERYRYREETVCSPITELHFESLPKRRDRYRVYTDARYISAARDLQRGSMFKDAAVWCTNLGANITVFTASCLPTHVHVVYQNVKSAGYIPSNRIGDPFAPYRFRSLHYPLSYLFYDFLKLRTDIVQG